MNRLLRLVRNYKMLCWLLVGFIAAVILQLLQHLTISHLIISAFSFIAILSILRGIWQSLRAGRYGIDLPGVIAAVVAVILQQYWACLIVVVTLIINEQLKTIIVRRVQTKQAALLEQLPALVHVFRKRKLTDIAVSDIRVGEEIEIRVGEVVPLDGMIVSGSGNFQEQLLTGESKPQHREVGEIILSGTTNLDETISAKVIRPASESQLRQLLRIEQTAVESAGQLAIHSDRYSVLFMMGAYIIAVAAWLVTRQPLRFLEVIIIVTPAPFLLAPILALTRGLYLAAKNGIIIKTNATFERLAHAKTFGFDKTNTLMGNIAEIDKVIAFKPYSQLDIETYAGSMLQRSDHALAHALKRFVITNKLKLLKTKHVKELPGFGAEARIGNKDIIIGQYGLLKERGIAVPQTFKSNTLSQTALCVGLHGNLIGYITFKDSYRSDIKPLLALLAQLRITNTVMMADDDQAIAIRIATQLGISDVKTTRQLGDKLLAIEAIEARPLVFVGDGLHDTSVLTAADVGIAIGARGSTVAAEAADIIIMQDNLRYIALAMTIAKQAVQRAKQAIFVAVGLSLLVALISATGVIQPLAGSFIRFGLEIIALSTVLIRRIPTAPR